MFSQIWCSLLQYDWQVYTPKMCIVQRILTATDEHKQKQGDKRDADVLKVAMPSILTCFNLILNFLEEMI